MILLILSGFLLFLAGSAYYSGAETAFYSANEIRLRVRAAQGHPGAEAALELLRDRPGLIASCMIGNNIVNYLLTIMGALLITASTVDLDASDIELWTTLLVAPITFLWGEIIPKNYCRQQADAVVPQVSRPLLFFKLLFHWCGVLPVLNWVSRFILRLVHQQADLAEALQPQAEVTALLREGVAHGVMTDQQTRLVEGVLKLSDLSLGRVMVPLAQVTTIDYAAGRAEALKLLREHPFSRYPVVQNRPDHIVGVIDVYEFLAAGEERVAAHMTHPLRLRVDTSVATALQTMRQTRQTFGIVMDRNNRATGIVSIKDLVEEIIGDLRVW
ncbi:MAG: hypothetical protein HJJLKODD_01274 [Phycisphaerae bacterium]|nr:hypothetical protein [Phycisphaerae bacterium]